MAKQKEPEVRSQDASGADWPVELPYTLYFPRRGGFAAADIEYSAPLPRVGDAIEYIDAQGIAHRYKVIDVVHTFQNSPTSTEPEAIRLLRAGLPQVYLARDRRKPRG
ncbi:MAG TPA: hypothetical protein VIC63_05565 [Candidatus Limnocylindria bacterium]|jgi:hypothetical protein